MIKSIIAKALKKARLSSIRQTKIHPTSKVEAGSSLYSSSMDRYSFCGYDCELYHVEVGSFTSIASRVVIGGARHPMEWVGMSPVFYKGRDSIRKKFSEYPLSTPAVTRIGSDVWIGDSAIVLSGVSIGNGAVVGAGSVVTKDVPPYGIAAGNPARLIRYRFDEATISELQEIRWWELEDDLLAALAQHVRDPSTFISAYHRIADTRFTSRKSVS